MGRWGFLLFQSDYDLDIASDLSRDAGVELYMYDAPELDGIGMEATRMKLNKGALAEVFDKYKKKTASEMFWSKEHYMVVLGALAMRVGATIRDEDMLTLENIYYHAGIPAESQAQFEQALRAYRNDGTPLVFDSPGLVETMMDMDFKDMVGLRTPGTTIFTLPYDKDEKNKNIPAEEPATSKENVEAAVVTNAAIKEEEPSPNVEAKDEEENKSDVLVEKQGGNKRGPSPDIVPMLVHNVVPRQNINFQFA